MICDFLQRKEEEKKVAITKKGKNILSKNRKTYVGKNELRWVVVITGLLVVMKKSVDFAHNLICLKICSCF